MELIVLDKPTDCDDCGACCMHAEALTPLTSTHLTDTLRQELERARDSLRFKRAEYRDLTPCVWLNLLDGSCQHHDERPDGCRIVPVAGEECLRVREEAAA